MSELFHGHTPRECGEHRTTGEHRAWCHDCSEWCYRTVSMACKGCRVVMLAAGVKAIVTRVSELPAESASDGRDFGRGYALAIRHVLEIIEDVIVVQLGIEDTEPGPSS